MLLLPTSLFLWPHAFLTVTHSPEEVSPAQLADRSRASTSSSFSRACRLASERSTTRSASHVLSRDRNTVSADRCDSA